MLLKINEYQFSILIHRFEASERCLSLGGSLITLKDSEIQLSVANALGGQNSAIVDAGINGLWTGLVRNQWIWVDGKFLENTEI